jgi:ubiquinone/menaquinone biosynthesis C-methylase UbiE
MSNENLTAREDEVSTQRAYHAVTAERYDQMHGQEREESLGMAFFLASVDQLGIRSILDVGSDTGFALFKVKNERPGIAVMGFEPSPELRAAGYAKGLADTELVDGNALALPFESSSFDLVCEFGALLHIPEPSHAVAEMLRVPRKAIYILDSNNFGQGSRLSRFLKQAINAVRLWPVADWIKTGGKGYKISEGDGLAYSYSVFSDYKQIARACKSVHMFNTSGGSANLYRTAAQISLLGIK